MDIKRDVRIKIITLKQNTNLTQAQIASKCNVSRPAVTKIIKRHSLTGSISPSRIGRCGRKRSTTPRDDRLLLRKSKLNAKTLHGVQVSLRTIRRRLFDFDRPARKPTKKPIFTKTMKRKRLNWAKAHKDDWTVDDWKKVGLL